MPGQNIRIHADNLHNISVNRENIERDKIAILHTVFYPIGFYKG